VTARRSVFLDALGDEAAKLRPEVYEYGAGPPPNSDETHLVGVGEGVFEVAGSRWGFLMGLLRPVIGPDSLVTRYERDVPFGIVNTPTIDGDGRPGIATTRTFRFRGGAQSFRDALVPSHMPGVLLNHLGSRPRLTIVLTCAVSERGHLLLTSRSAHVRIGRRRIRLPRLLGVAARVEDGFDTEHGRRTIDVDVRNPIVGTVMRYRGWFQYRYTEDVSPA
jgi:hypothetical protein